MSKADDILLFDVIFSLMLLTFGAATGVVSLQSFQAITSPNLLQTPPGSFKNCQNSDLGCISQNIALATAYIGWAVLNLPSLIIFFAQLFITFGNLVLSITFSPSFNANGVPYLGIFFSGLQLYIIWEVIRTIRGSSTGV